MVPVYLLALFLPIKSFAARNLKDLIGEIFVYLDYAIYLIIGLATVVFVWNVYQYFFTEKGGEDRKKAGEYVLWSVVGFCLILSFWGLVNLLGNTLDLDSTRPRVPYLQNSASGGSGVNTQPNAMTGGGSFITNPGGTGSGATNPNSGVVNGSGSTFTPSQGTVNGSGNTYNPSEGTVNGAGTSNNSVDPSNTTDREQYYTNSNTSPN